jgi:hypothetical protein
MTADEESCIPQAYLPTVRADAKPEAAAGVGRVKSLAIQYGETDAL